MQVSNAELPGVQLFLLKTGHILPVNRILAVHRVKKSGLLVDY
jgi:hypothetical protein